MCTTPHNNNPRPAPAQLPPEQIHKQEMADMIRRELALNTILTFRKRTRHDRRIADKDIDILDHDINFFRCSSNGRLRGEVERDECCFYAWVGGVDGGYDGLDFWEGAACEDHVGGETGGYG